LENISLHVLYLFLFILLDKICIGHIDTICMYTVVHMNHDTGAVTSKILKILSEGHCRYTTRRSDCFVSKLQWPAEGYVCLLDLRNGWHSTWPWPVPEIIVRCDVGS